MTPLCLDKPSLNSFNVNYSPKITSEIDERKITMKNIKLINSLI